MAINQETDAFEEMDRESLLSTARELSSAYRDLQISFDIAMEHNSALENQLYQSNCDLQIDLLAREAALKLTREQAKRTQEHLIMSEKFARLGSLVAGFSHELNTPIHIAALSAAVVGELAVRFAKILPGLALEPAAQASLGRDIAALAESSQLLGNNLDRAVAMISAFKQSTLDQTRDSVRVCRVAELVSTTLDSLKPRFRGTAFRLEWDCPEDLAIESYPGTLAQILINLITNSLLHGFDGLPDGTIRVSVQEATPDGEGPVVLSCVDDGRGIDPEVMPRIFEQFFTTKEGAGGSGLGLHIVRTLVEERLGGSIECRSRPLSPERRGETRFEIRIPRRISAP